MIIPRSEGLRARNPSLERYQTSVKDGIAARLNSAHALEILPGEIPIDQFLAHLLEKVGPFVLVVEIVSVFPEINGEDAALTLRHRRDGIGRGFNGKLALVGDEPDPPAAELFYTGLEELVLEFV